MAESYPSSGNNHDNTAEPDLFAWLEQTPDESTDPNEVRQSALIAKLAQLQENKQVIADTLKSCKISPFESRLHEIGIDTIVARCEELPLDISYCLDHYFALNPDHTDRIRFTRELLDATSRDALNTTDLPLDYTDDLASIDLPSVYQGKPETSFVMAVQRHAEGHIYSFADNVAKYYGF